MSDAEIGRPIVLLIDGGLTLADVRRWVADMTEAGAEDTSPAFGRVVKSRPGFPSSLPGGIEQLTGLGGLSGIGGFPRVSSGPVPAPPADKRVTGPGRPSQRPPAGA